MPPFNPASISGLSASEAAERFKLEGANSLPVAKPHHFTALALEVLREPMFSLLFAGGAIYLVLGDTHEAMLLLSFVILIAGITIYQQRKTERTLAALRDLSSPRARVIRDGREMRVAGYELVRGDVVVLAEGDRVPADAVLLGCNDLAADESLLTGEAVAVRKTPWDGIAQIGRPGGDDLPFVYSGSLLTQGQGVAEVVATGSHTEIGKIGKALQMLDVEPTPLQKEITRVVAKLAIAALLLCLIVAVAYALTRGGWLQGLLVSITLAMAIIPNEYPAVLTIFLALGAWRISKQRVLTRRIPAIEALGSATVLCVDKTGTLTLNRMTVKKLCVDGEFHDVGFDAADLPEQFHELVEYSILASEIEPYDPMEQAFHLAGRHYLAGTEHLHQDWRLVQEYALTHQFLAHAHGWKRGDDLAHAVAAKGAPEAIADLCHVAPAVKRQIERQTEAMAAEGLRVLGVARAKFAGGEWPQNQHDLDFEFVGLVGLADPVRPTVVVALKECYSAGMRVVMITGDYPITAQAIAREIGLASAGGVLTGVELDALSDAELQNRIRQVNIYARVVPEQKLRLVQAFKANGEVVAMTGDGVNDAPALKAAHIGIAMGGRGTDVAREAADLVLLDDDFASIVHAVRIGRRIYDNIQNAMCYLLAVHVPIAGMSFIPLLFGWPLAFFPVHVVFIEFVVGSACSIAFEAEAEQSGVMNRPPRSPKTPLFSRSVLLISLLQGASVLVAVGGIYGIALHYGVAEFEARALAFVTIVLGNLGLMLSNRSRTQTLFTTLRAPNPMLWLIIGGTLAALALVLYLPALSGLFCFSPLSKMQWLLCLVAAMAGVLWLEGYKFLRRENPS